VLYRCEGEWPTVGEWFTGRERIGALTSLCFSHDGSALVMGRRSGWVSVLDIETARSDRPIELASGAADVAFVEQVTDGRRLLLLTAPGEDDEVAFASGSPSATLRLWDLAARAELRTHELLPPSLIALSPDGRHLAWVIHHPARSPAEVVFWDVAAWRGAGSVEWDCEDTITALAFSPAGDEVATGSQGGAVKLVPWRRLLGA
jgi:WD40 repeat protein